jgi:hypothetical protein
MTGEQSRTLSVGERVCWGAATTDLATSIQHNDMAQDERVLPLEWAQPALSDVRLLPS